MWYRWLTRQRVYHWLCRWRECVRAVWYRASILWPTLLTTVTVYTMMGTQHTIMFQITSSSIWIVDSSACWLFCWIILLRFEIKQTCQWVKTLVVGFFDQSYSKTYTQFLFRTNGKCINLRPDIFPTSYFVSIEDFFSVLSENNNRLD